MLTCHVSGIHIALSTPVRHLFIPPWARGRGTWPGGMLGGRQEPSNNVTQVSRNVAAAYVDSEQPGYTLYCSRNASLDVRQVSVNNE